jgi:hypothetical protein
VRPNLNTRHPLLVKEETTKQAFGDIGGFLSSLTNNMNFDSIKPYLGFLNPIYQAVGGAVGIPGMAAMTDMFRGGENIKLLSRGLTSRLGQQQDASAPSNLPIAKYIPFNGQQLGDGIAKQIKAVTPKPNLFGRAGAYQGSTQGGQFANNLADKAQTGLNFFGDRVKPLKPYTDELGKQTRNFLNPIGQAGGAALGTIKGNNYNPMSGGLKSMATPFSGDNKPNNSTKMTLTNGAAR